MPRSFKKVNRMNINIERLEKNLQELGKIGKMPVAELAVLLARRQIGRHGSGFCRTGRVT